MPYTVCAPITWTESQVLHVVQVGLVWGRMRVPKDCHGPSVLLRGQLAMLVCDSGKKRMLPSSGNQGKAGGESSSGKNIIRHGIGVFPRMGKDFIAHLLEASRALAYFLHASTVMTDIWAGGSPLSPHWWLHGPPGSLAALDRAGALQGILTSSQD